MLDMSKHADQIAYAVIVLLGTLNVFFLQKIKKDTGQVNNAVNHVGPNGKPLTERVDRIEETLHTIQYDQDQAKQAAIAAKDLAAGLGTDITDTRQMVESLMSSHVKTRDKLDEIVKFLPKRKDDLENPEYS